MLKMMLVVVEIQILLYSLLLRGKIKMAILHPQEIFMIERYTSLERLKKLHETWSEFLTKSKGYLDAYAKNPPKDPSLMESYKDVVSIGRVKFFLIVKNGCRQLTKGACY